MVQEIELILSKPVKEVISSPLSLTLLKIYSTLYLGGAQPRWCERSQTSYYNQLATDGILKAKQMENSGVLERTCELKPDMIIYVSSLAMHITKANITDWIACEGLTKGFLKESQFVKLPDCWLNKDEAKEILPIEEKTVETKVETKVETRGRKKHNR